MTLLDADLFHYDKKLSLIYYVAGVFEKTSTKFVSSRQNGHFNQ